MELGAYLVPLRKWWWLIVAATAVAAGASYFAVSQQPPVYQARATLLLGSAISNPNPTGNELWLSEQLAATYTDIAYLDVVQEGVKTTLGLNWLPGYSAQQVPGTQLIEIVVTDSSPERAMVVANELANQLILQTPASGTQADDQERQAFIAAQLDELEVKIGETREEIAAKQQELAGLFSARQIADTRNQIGALESKLDTLQANYASLLANTTAGAANSLQVIQPATVPASPIGPEVLMTVVTAAAIGLSLAVGAAYLLEYLDDTVKTTQDVRRASGLEVLSGVAEYPPAIAKASRPVALDQPRAPVVEGYRALRTAVAFANLDDPAHVLLVTSASPGEGKSTTAANLAIVMAQAGHKVLLIDADLRRPAQHTIFGRARGYGLTNLLVDMPPGFEPSRLGDMFTQLTKAVTATAQAGLFFLSSGDIPPNPAEAVGSVRMAALLQAFATRFDYVILDTPPVLAVTDAVILSTRADSVLLVSRTGRTRRSELENAVRRLQSVKAVVAGVIMNRMPADSSESYQYYSAHYYASADEGPEPAAAAVEDTTKAAPSRPTLRPSVQGRSPG